jgi:23S rRNA (guanine745-N1)-methyltransferase
LIPEIARHLRCPVCAEPLARAEASLICPRGHGFDLARQGYVNLVLGPATHCGDSAEMVASRSAFQQAGHYDFVAEAIAEAVRAAVGDSPGLVVDVGAGTGYYLAAVLDRAPAALGLALDASKHAARRAARAHARMSAAVCDVWKELPLVDGAADVILSVFAPRNAEELARVLRPEGTLIVVTPQTSHLQELVGQLGMLSVPADKEERLEASLAGRFRMLDEALHARRLSLSHAEAQSLVAMGPSAWHLEPGVLAERVAKLPEPVEVGAAIRLSRWARR